MFIRFCISSLHSFVYVRANYLNLAEVSLWYTCVFSLRLLSLSYRPFLLGIDRSCPIRRSVGVLKLTKWAVSGRDKVQKWWWQFHLLRRKKKSIPMKNRIRERREPSQEKMIWPQEQVLSPWLKVLWLNFPYFLLFLILFSSPLLPLFSSHLLILFSLFILLLFFPPSLLPSD